ncbi:hypothetical protein M8J77_005397 [Diaphorina citri]|nr:hypothetical protein M8J77_005397 [Diaphorina citri]
MKMSPNMYVMTILESFTLLQHNNGIISGVDIVLGDIIVSCNLKLCPYIVDADDRCRQKTVHTASTTWIHLFTASTMCGQCPLDTDSLILVQNLENHHPFRVFEAKDFAMPTWRVK